MISRQFTTKIKQLINVTVPAWNKMTEISEKSNNQIGFLFTATTGGCNGFNYHLNLLNKEEYNDIHVGKIMPTRMEHNNLKLFIDPIAELYLIGTTIDYVKEDYDKNIFESKFLFNPDKDKATACGCGISFSMKTV